MSGSTFDAPWLALREPVDHRSRAESLSTALAAEGTRRGWSRVVDLGTGTGSNLRYLDPRLPWVESWTVVDHDADLLRRLTQPASGRELRRVAGDIAVEGLRMAAEADLVTASALLDLVSHRWMEQMVETCRAAGAAALFALTYDGSVRWALADPEDDAVLAAVNRHQHGDKGLGAALGPEAANVAEGLFSQAGYRTESVYSPWILEGPQDAALARELTHGWVQAAAEVWAPDPDHGGEGPADGLTPGLPARLQGWQDRRQAQIDDGGFRIEVGHRDLLALPPF